MDEYDESSDVEMVPIEEIDKIRTTSTTELRVRKIILILPLLINTVIKDAVNTNYFIYTDSNANIRQPLSEIHKYIYNGYRYIQ